jgi:hypothetical protein
MSNDIAIGVSSRVPSGGVTVNKPSYLITLEQNVGKNKGVKYFITLDKPELLNGFVQTKGLFIDNGMLEEEIIANYSSILVNAKKESILDILFPSQRIFSMRSLIFKAK